MKKTGLGNGDLHTSAYAVLETTVQALPPLLNIYVITRVGSYVFSGFLFEGHLK